MPILAAAAYPLRWPEYADPWVAGLCRSLTRGIGFSPDSKRAYVAAENADEVYVSTRGSSG
jgi:hypothetical protein